MKKILLSIILFFLFSPISYAGPCLTTIASASTNQLACADDDILNVTSTGSITYNDHKAVDLEDETGVQITNDGTIEILKEIASKDKKFKVIINSKNYGHIKSPFHGLLQTDSDATILMATDFQDPVKLIPKYIERWKKGSKIVLGKKKTSTLEALLI